MPVYAEGTDAKPEEIAERGIKAAKDGGYDFVVVDTAGRQVVDLEMMEEIKRVRKASRPHSVLLVLDVVTGQNAVEVAEAFKEYADFDGMVLTKLDGDARGGAALSVVSVTERPVRFASEGEKMGEFDYFYPDRMAGRILGMGDVLTLIEKAEGEMDREEAEADAKRLMSGKFTFEDFLKQMRMIKRMGPLSGPARHDPRPRDSAEGRRDRRPGAGQGGGDGHVDDQQGAAQPEVVAEPEPGA